ncbi:MAG: nucleotide sugar dehydrogenase [Chloroflexi bacterium]|nr:nucleotide sugar dehydrogenase [Chloroflexota bacterium]
MGGTKVDFNKVCVLGMGYIGLPTASTLAMQGMEVVGVDANARVVRILRDGEIHIHEPGLRTLAQAAFNSGRLTIKDEPEEADAFILAVQTPLRENHQADMAYVVSAAESIVPFLRSGNLVVLESTSPPRTTMDLLAPILEQSGLTTGEDYYLAYTPERVLPGQILKELIDNARVIGGYDRSSAEAGRDLYLSFVRGEIYLTDATTAEMVKLMENTARDISIAVANEFSRLAEHFGLSVWEAIELANLHPRVNILRPGPGVGGHCISIDPYFLIQAAPEMTGLMQRARTVNDGQPAFVVARIERDLQGLSDRRIAALGLAYKADVDDLRNSPAVEVARLLASKGAKVATFEPFALEAVPEGCVPAGSLEDAVKDADAVALLVDHRQFRELDPQALASQMPGREAFDTRGVWSSSVWEQGGFRLHTLGVRAPDA